jgi:hypothetical protein
MAESAPTIRRSALDGAVRWVLRVEDAEPRALMSMRGSLVLSAIRCLVTYVAIPLAVPLIGWLAGVTTPLTLALSAAAVALAVNNLRRVWIADWAGRWGYLVFSLLVFGVLVGLMITDIRALTA